MSFLINIEIIIKLNRRTKMDFVAADEQETTRIAADLANRLNPGTIVALYGTLGAGKTAFCRGFIQALTHDKTDVPSPTFTLLQTYETSKCPIYHFDMYRLKTPEEVYEIGIEDAFVEGISLIEWPEKLGNLLPKNHLSVIITILPDNTRQITIK